MDITSETNDLMHDLKKMEEDNHPGVYKATLVSVLMLQRRGKTDDMIEKRINCQLYPEHKMSIISGIPSILQIKIEWLDVPKIGQIQEKVLGHFELIIQDVVYISQDMTIYAIVEKIDEISQLISGKNVYELHSTECDNVLSEIKNNVENRIKWLQEINVIDN